MDLRFRSEREGDDPFFLPVELYQPLWIDLPKGVKIGKLGERVVRSRNDNKITER